MHDIGRRVGIVNIPKHVYEGYMYSAEKGWDEVSRFCMTHSYPIKERDFAEEVQDEEIFIKGYIVKCTYDEYDNISDWYLNQARNDIVRVVSARNQ